MQQKCNTVTELLQYAKAAHFTLKECFVKVGVYCFSDVWYVVTEYALSGEFVHARFVGIACERVPGVMRRVTEGGKGSFVCSVPKLFIVVRV